MPDDLTWTILRATGFRDPVADMEVSFIGQNEMLPISNDKGIQR